MSSKSVSVIGAVMNRGYRIEYAVETWLAAKGVSEVIVVDWSSEATPSLPRDPRLKVVRVEGEKMFILSQAYNLAASYAQGDFLIKADADYCFEPDILARLDLKEGEFCRGDNEGMSPDENARSLNGFLALPLQDFHAIGGYNERLIGYGWDDDDIYNRLELHGLHKRTVGEEIGVSHLPHPRTLRTVNMESDDYKAMRKKNRAISKLSTWTAEDKKVEWTSQNGALIRLP